MSETTQDPDFVMHPGEKTTMLFIQMVFQLSSLATMLLGKAPHPETGKTQRDLESAQMVIDQLDMLAAKTKGNLNKEEEQLLKQTLMGLRMAYVEATSHPAPAEAVEEKASAPAETATPAETPNAAPAPDEASKKKFTKKY